MKESLLETKKSFNYEWKKFPKVFQSYESEFLDWIKPIRPSSFKNKTILDAGCGSGRHSYFVANCGAKKVIAMDLNIEIPSRLLNGLKNVKVVKGNIYNPPLKEKFDIIYCIGVLHHMPDPEKGFKSLVKLLKPKGTILIWVYGRENFFFTHIINNLRKLTSNLPYNVLYVATFFLAILLHLTTKIYQVFRFMPMPYKEYFLHIGKHPFEFKHFTCFDLLSPPIAYCHSKEEVKTWFEKAGLKDIKVISRNKNSWKGIGTLSKTSDMRL